MSEKINKKKKYVVILLSLLIILLLFISIFYYINNKPKKVFMSYVNNNIKNILNTIDDNKTLDFLDFITNNDNIEYDFSVLATEKVNNEKIDINTKYNIVTNKDTIKLNYDIKEKDNNLTKGSIIYKDNKKYVKYDGFSKYYYDEEEFNLNDLFKFYNKDYIKVIKKIINQLPDAMQKCINEEDIIKTNEKINILNEDINVEKYKLVINKSLEEKIINEYSSYIKNDEEFINILTSMLNISKEELINRLDNNNLAQDEELIFNIYAKNNDVILFEIIDEDLVIKYSNYKNNIQISLFDEDDDIIINISKDNDKYYIVFKNHNKEVLDGNVKLNNDVLEYDLNIKSDNNQSINLSGTLSFYKENDAYKIATQFKLSYNLLIYNFMIELNIDGTIKKGYQLEVDEIKNADSFENINSKDKKILENQEYNYDSFFNSDMDLNDEVLVFS